MKISKEEIIMYQSYVSNLASSIFLLSTFYFLLSCTEPTEPIIEKGKISLTAETVAASFIRFKLEISSEQEYDGFEVYRGNTLVKKDSISGRDTVFYDGGLQPNSSYEYKASLIKKGVEIDTGKILAVTTGATTSHDYTWQVDTIGVFPSILRDVTIIDTNNVWAVGSIERTEYPNSDYYNAVKWNGSSYEYQKIFVKSYSGQSSAQPLKAAISFSKNNIWLLSGNGGSANWNGIEWNAGYIEARKGSINDVWGFSSSDFYIVGDNGSITHYDGTSFTLMESGTYVDLFKVTGYKDPETGKKTVWAAGTSTLLNLVDGQWSENIWETQNPTFENNYKFIRSIYVQDTLSIIMSVWNNQSSRLYCFDQANLKNNVLLTEQSSYSHDFEGLDYNNLVTVGSFNIVEHYNGFYTNLFSALRGGGYQLGVKMYKNHIYSVGEAPQLGLFFHGRQN